MTVILWTAAVHAEAFSSGTVAIATPGPITNCTCRYPLEMKWLDANGGTFQSYLAGSGPGNALGTLFIGNSGQLLVPLFDITHTTLLTFDSSGQKIGEVVIPLPISTAVARSDGSIVAASNLDASSSMYVLDKQGSVIQQYTFTGIDAPFDLAPDGCTVLSTTGDAVHIARFDVCTGQALPSWKIDAPGATDVRALADGGAVAVTSSSTPELWFLDSTGAIVRRLPVPLAHQEVAGQIMFGSDPNYVWLGFNRTLENSTRLARVRLDTGTVVTSQPFTSENLSSFAVYGETRPSLAAVTASTVPTLSSWFLMALACVCAAIAVRRVNG